MHALANASKNCLNTVNVGEGDARVFFNNMGDILFKVMIK